MTKRPYSDAEIRSFLDRLPRRLTFTEMHEALASRFGPERAWSRSKIARYWHDTHPARKGFASRLDQDRELRAFVEDRLGRITLDQIVAECRARFGPKRTPGRSSIHRHWKKVANR